MFDSIRKALKTLQEKPYFKVEMETNGRGEGLAIKADWNESFIDLLDAMGYDKYETDDDKVDAYIRNCYMSAAKQEGVDMVSNLPDMEEE